MKFSYFDLNIEKGKYLDAALSYIQECDFDVLALQEVGGGQYNDYDGEDLFKTIQEKLGYSGELASTLKIKNDEKSYFGNAVFYKKDFTVLEKKIVWMKDFLEIKDKNLLPFTQYPKNALSIKFEKDGQQFHVISTHLAWGPNSLDEPYKIAQGEKLFDYVKTLDLPFVLSGDFNVDKNSQVVKWLDSEARNLAVENNITNTLNPNLHRAKHLFPPGLAVDFAYIGNGFTYSDFHVVEKDLSDHYGLSVNIEM